MITRWRTRATPRTSYWNKAGVLKRAAAKIKVLLEPFLWKSDKGAAILKSPSCVTWSEVLIRRKVCIYRHAWRLISTIQCCCSVARRLLTHKDTSRMMMRTLYQSCDLWKRQHNGFSAKRELRKGNGGGSVFIELAREGRSLSWVLFSLHSNQMWGALTCSREDYRYSCGFQHAFWRCSTYSTSEIWFAGLETRNSNALSSGCCHCRRRPYSLPIISCRWELHESVRRWIVGDDPSRNKEIPNFHQKMKEKRTKTSSAAIEDRLTVLMRKSKKHPGGC